MMYTEFTGLILIIANIAFSWKGFADHSFFERYKFRVENILVRKEYIRLVSSGFLHTGWAHLLFNMFSLFFFSGIIERLLGAGPLLLIYFAGLIGGGLLSLLIHRQHGSYSAVGASGAVCGVIFAAIALFPGLKVGLFMLPLAVPAWLFGLLYVLISIYGIRSGRDNIGHESHLGGAVIGLLTAIALYPQVLADNLATIAIIMLPSFLFIYLMATRPDLLLVDSHFFKARQANYTIDQRYNIDKKGREAELDRILEKIHKKGMNSLTRKEKDTLKKYS